MIGYGPWKGWRIEHRCAGPIKVRTIKPRGAIWHQKWPKEPKGMMLGIWRSHLARALHSGQV